MTSRYRIAIRAYPTSYRCEHGDEIVATANELAPHRWSFRQARSLLFEGLRTRAWQSSNGTSSQLWASGIALAFAIRFLLSAAFGIANLLGATGYITVSILSPWISMTLVLIPLAALTMTTRWPAALAITTLPIVGLVNSVRLRGGTLDDYPITAGLVTWLIVSLITSVLAWWMASRASGRRAISPTTALAMLTVTVSVFFISDSPQIVTDVVLYLALPIIGLLLVTVDPRSLITATTLWFFFAARLIPDFVIGIDGTTKTALAIAIPSAVITVGALLSRLGTRRLTGEVPVW